MIQSDRSKSSRPRCPTVRPARRLHALGCKQLTEKFTKYIFNLPRDLYQVGFEKFAIAEYNDLDAAQDLNTAGNLSSQVGDLGVIKTYEAAAMHLAPFPGQYN